MYYSNNTFKKIFVSVLSDLDNSIWVQIPRIIGLICTDTELYTKWVTCLSTDIKYTLNQSQSGLGIRTNTDTEAAWM